MQDTLERTPGGLVAPKAAVDRLNVHEGLAINVLLPNEGWMLTELTRWLMVARQMLGNLGVKSASYLYSTRRRPDEARNELIQRAREFASLTPKLEHWCLWIDADMGPETDCLSPLFIEMLQHPEIDFITAFCARKQDLDPGVLFDLDGKQMMPYIDYQPGEIVEVGMAGFAFALHRLSLFDGVDKPFEMIAAKDEDIRATKDLRAKGKRLFTHTGIVVKHYDPVPGKYWVPHMGAKLVPAK